MRLVVFDCTGRVAIPIFNEKVMCGLGRTDSSRPPKPGSQERGPLNPLGKRQTLQTLRRFRVLLDEMGVDEVYPTATAALREASDGPAFVHEIISETGFPISVITGDEEARISALGVISGMSEVDGVAGDLGGGSLELMGIAERRLHNQISLPLGPFRLQAQAGERSAMIPIIRQSLDTADWLAGYAGRSFYAVGGAWRAIAKIHMQQVNHPLHIVHHYTLDAEEAIDFTDLLSRQSKGSLERMGSIPRRRLDVLPQAALLLHETLAAMQPKNVIFSAYGLREGLLFDLLDEEERLQDPLLAACALIESRSARFPGSQKLFDWLGPLFPDESYEMARLRRAACALSDFCWAEHPDYRAEHAFMRIMRMSVTGIDHTGRAILGLATFRRYGGTDAPGIAVADMLLTEAERRHAEILGAALRLAHSMTGGVEATLSRCALRLEKGQLNLEAEADLMPLMTDTVDRRMSALAKLMDCTYEIRQASGKTALTAVTG